MTPTPTMVINRPLCNMTNHQNMYSYFLYRAQHEKEASSAADKLCRSRRARYWWWRVVQRVSQRASQISIRPKQRLLPYNEWSTDLPEPAKSTARGECHSTLLLHWTHAGKGESFIIVFLFKFSGIFDGKRWYIVFSHLNS